MYNREREVNRMNYTYILRCSDGTYYTGWTNDMAKRLKTHNEGKGAKYTRARLPVTLAYYEAFEMVQLHKCNIEVLSRSSI